MLGFETLTLAPIHSKLIALDLLTEAEITYLNTYHKRVLTEIGPHLPENCLNWLVAACEDIKVL